jgi:hypothetical protein
MLYIYVLQLQNDKYYVGKTIAGLLEKMSIERCKLLQSGSTFNELENSIMYLV